MRLRELLLALGVGAALTVILTWPIAARFDRAGRLDSGDGRLSVWNVSWVAHALTTNPFQLFNANIFHPHQNSLAFSEANVLAGVIAVPVWLLTENPHATSNWAILCSFVLSFVTTLVLVRRLTGSVAGAALAGLWFAFCPYVFSHIPHMQLLMTFGLPLTLLRMHHFVEAPTAANAGWLGGAMAIQGLACGYYFIFGGLLAGLGVVWFGIASGRWRDWRYWGLAIVAAGITAALLLPFYAPYIDVRAAGFERTLDDARLHSVRWRSYLASPRLADQWLLPLIGSWREVLFPGALPILFSGVAIFRVLRRPGASAPIRRGVLAFYLTVGALGFWASLGPDGGLYTLLHETVPFFGFLRAPARFGLLVTLSLAVVGGMGFASLERLLAGRTRTLAVVAVAAIAMARSTVGGLFLVDAPPVPVAHQRLVPLPRGPVAMFPFWSSSADRHRHTEYMVMSTTHWKPLINGYSDHLPADAYADLLRLATFPSVDAWQVLRDHQARYVVMHWNLYPSEERSHVVAQIRALRNQLRLIVDGTDASLYEIVGWPEGTN